MTWYSSNNEIKSGNETRTRSGGLASRRVVALAAALAPILMCCQTAKGVDDQNVMRVEEDWEVVLNYPDSDVEAPQFHTVISPFAHVDSFHLQITWNYREETDFAGGGMQLRAWNGEFAAGSKSYREDKLSTTAETITWSQTMNLDANGTLTFAVENGSSSTWGAFGGTSATSLTGKVLMPTLNDYSTATSVKNSWITYGANRVDEIRINEVRRYNAAGVLLSRDTTPRIVYQPTE